MSTYFTTTLDGYHPSPGSSESVRVMATILPGKSVLGCT